MTEQPQLFLIPAETLSRVINFLGELPFKQVAPLMSMIEQTVKPLEKENGTSERSVRKRTGSSE